MCSLIYKVFYIFPLHFVMPKLLICLGFVLCVLHLTRANANHSNFMLEVAKTLLFFVNLKLNTKYQKHIIYSTKAQTLFIHSVLVR